jgi:F-type H+-transporting ATPase subunit epsilon
MHVTVISAEAAIFDGDASAVVAPAFDGEVGIFPRHAPLTTLLGEGRLTVRRPEGDLRFAVRGGFLQVVDDIVRVVAEHVQGEANAS